MFSIETSRFFIIQLVFLFAILVEFCSCANFHTGHAEWHTYVNVIRPFSSNISTRFPNKIDALNFLMSYGYLNNTRVPGDGGPKQIKLPNVSEVEESIRKFQRLYKLNVTGKLDKATIKKMQQPRCGAPDFSILKTNKKFLRVRREAENIQDLWNHRNLTYKIIKPSSSLNFSIVRNSIARAFQDWSDVTDFKFVERLDQDEITDIVLSFEEGDHLDGAPFQFQEVAHAFYPRDGRVHFNDDFEFTENSTQGYNLRLVATHEIGHTIGLQHTFERTSIMYPNYVEYIENFTLSEYDVTLVKSLFKKNDSLRDDNIHQSTTPSILSTLTSTSTGHIQTQASTNVSRSPAQIFIVYKQNKATNDPEASKSISSISPCSEKFRVVLKSPKNVFYVITANSSNLWEFNPKLGGYWRVHGIQEGFFNLPSDVKGGHRCKKNLTWFFKDQMVWAYGRGVELLADFPVEIELPWTDSRLLYNVIEKDGIIYLQRGKLAYPFDTTRLRLEIDKPRPISELFPGIPRYTDASFYHKGLYYFFYNIWVYRFDPVRNHVLAGDPQIKSSIFEPCSKQSKNLEV